jgi:hypothetical protein
LIAGATISALIPGCTSRTSDEGASPPEDGTSTDSPEPNSPSTLSADLQLVVDAADPEQYAREQGYDVEDGAIRVVTEVRSGDSIPQELVESVEYNHEHRYELFVRFENLQPLARNDAVQHVRLPAKPATNAND